MIAAVVHACCASGVVATTFIATAFIATAAPTAPPPTAPAAALAAASAVASCLLGFGRGVRMRAVHCCRHCWCDRAAHCRRRRLLTRRVIGATTTSATTTTAALVLGSCFGAAGSFPRLALGSLRIAPGLLRQPFLGFHRAAFAVTRALSVAVALAVTIAIAMLATVTIAAA